MEKLDRNKDVILNYGLIAYGPLREIEKLQKRITAECKQLRIVYQTVSTRKLKLVKIREEKPFLLKFKARLTGDAQRGQTQKG